MHLLDEGRYGTFGRLNFLCKGLGAGIQCAPGRSYDGEVLMSSDDNQNDRDDRDEIVTEEMLWDRIPQTEGEDRAETYYELSARIS